ncbi:C11orf49 [Bugula neritina]|uniref:Centriolar satellite-associated tubulin polyglutamylase complex regulator 1 n=1 Tax=Bugula neritina TaxID=10212 RepID=A0A7J7J554_BUGNE|nr:C11orf49 [Bugula neritina]
MLQKTAKIVLIDDAHDCLISFTDFLYSFQLQLYYQEFLEASSNTYQSLLTESHSPRDIVVPTDHTTQVHKEKQLPSNSTLTAAEGVDSMKFYKSLSQLIDKYRFSIPSLATLKEILSASLTTTFYGFLVALSKSEAINSGIGRLPASTNIFDGVESSSLLKVQSVTIPTKQTEEKPSEGDQKSSVIQENLKKPTQSQQTKSESMKTAPKVFTKKSTERARQISTESSSDADSSESDST